MTSFSIDTSSALSVAAGLESEEQAIVQYIRGTVQLAEEMASTWKGNAPAAYQQAKAIWDEGIKKMDVGMSRACAVLRNNVNSYHSTDQDLQSLFSGFQV
jgi:WXG100 family type VII secretion target